MRADLIELPHLNSVNICTDRVGYESQHFLRFSKERHGLFSLLLTYHYLCYKLSEYSQSVSVYRPVNVLFAPKPVL